VVKYIPGHSNESALLERFSQKAGKLKPVKAYRLRSVTATALSLWLGVLACVLGCAKPSAASTSTPETKNSGLSAAPCPDRDGDSGGSCCRHGHDVPGNSGKNRHQEMSCCPAEAALVQKQTVVSPAAVHVFVLVSTLLAFDPAGLLDANGDQSPIVWHAGREILLRVHVLRI
jgi:hypothetical protein